MYKIILAILIIMQTISVSAQDIKKEAKLNETKMEAFSSKTGIITKFIDYKLSDLKLYLGSKAETRIRKVISGGESSYFFQIEKSGQYNNSTASIEYSDLLEVIKALTSLKVEVDKDASSKPDYLENKFTTVDGFQVGYYVSDNKIKWYLTLEKYGTDKTIFINDVATIENAFQEAKTKIEEVKK